MDHHFPPSCIFEDGNLCASHFYFLKCRFCLRIIFRASLRLLLHTYKFMAYAMVIFFSPFKGVNSIIGKRSRLTMVIEIRSPKASTTFFFMECCRVLGFIRSIEFLVLIRNRFSANGKTSRLPDGIQHYLAPFLFGVRGTDSLFINSSCSGNSTCEKVAKKVSDPLQTSTLD